MNALKAVLRGAGTGLGGCWHMVILAGQGEGLDISGKAVADRAADHGALQWPNGGVHGEPAGDLGRQAAS
jgi:hypothetical protein